MHAPNGEAAYTLTAPMLEALHALLDAEPHAINIHNVKTAVALLNRGFIQRADAGYKLDTLTTYHITKCGRTAYNITKRQALGNEVT